MGRDGDATRTMSSRAGFVPAIRIPQRGLNCGVTDRRFVPMAQDTRTPTLTITGLRDYERCPALYKLKHLERVRGTDTFSRPRAIGIAVHETLRVCHQRYAKEAAFPTNLGDLIAR